MAELIRMGGVELLFLQSRESGSSLDLFEMTLQPKARMPVPHHHESWDEAVYGLEGTTTYRVGDMVVELPPGESLFIGCGVVHDCDNRSNAPAKSLIVLTPGVLGPAYFREVAALAAAGTPDPARMKETMLRYGLVPAP
jgi:quercetin dioxygenase-like cupin family protein